MQKILVACVLLGLIGCQSHSRTIAKEPEKPYAQCFPKAYKVVSESSYKSQNGGLYWQISSVHKSSETPDSVEFLHFRTNGDCEAIGNSSISKLQFMPKDAAVMLARKHYEPYFNKCLKAKGKAFCVKEFEKTFNTPSDKENFMDQSVVWPEDVIALKQLGVRARVRLPHRRIPPGE
jgi:hypothetical protein